MSTTTGRFAVRDARALGVAVRLVVTDPAVADDALALLLSQCADLDLACSRFRDDSEIVRLDGAAGHPVRVSPLLARAVAIALDAARATGGDVDPTLGAQLSDLGYDRDFAVVRAAGDPGPVVVRSQRRARWTDVRLDLDAGVLAVPPGVRLDLGATAKAWAADVAAARIAEQFAVGTLVALGGDLAVAGPAPDGGWPIDIRVTEQDPVAATVSISSGGIATSGTASRRWVRGGHWLHHVLDPRTGLPAATPFRAVTVAAPTCLAANVATTAAVVRGARGLESLRRSGFPALTVADDGALQVLNGWPEPV